MQDEKITINDLNQTELESLEEILLNTREQGQLVEQLIKNQIQIKDEMIDRLHKELDYYKQDAAGRFIEQFLKSMIKIHAEMGKRLSSEKWEVMSVEDVKREYGYIYEDLTDLLEQQNIDSYHSNLGDAFDASIHMPKMEITHDPYLNKKVKQSLADGYRKGDKVLLPERVIVYQFKESE